LDQGHPDEDRQNKQHPIKQEALDEKEGARKKESEGKNS